MGKPAVQLSPRSQILSVFFLLIEISLHSAAGELEQPAGDKREVDEGRQHRLLNVFNIVRFPNEGCNTTGSQYGVCYTATECEALGGTAAGTCASGFGVCCAFSGTCGGSTSVNNTYFVSDGSESSPCQFRVCPTSTEVCQLRLGFDTFDIVQPSTSQSGDAVPGQRTQCVSAQFSASSDGPAAPVICGTNTGQHMILESQSECNTLTFTWTVSGTRSWNIHVMQIACTAEWRPSPGCLQWFTGTTGTISSYNYLGSTQIANQLYSVCIRSERGYCSISYTEVGTTGFELSGQTPGAGDSSVLGDSCTTDYIIIAGAGDSPTANTNYDRFCGGSLNLSPPSSTPATIYTNKMPYMVGVVFDGTELDSPPATSTELSKGFSVYYSQAAC